MKNTKMQVKFNSELCCFQSIKFLLNDIEHEFLLNPDEFPEFQGADSRWLGTICIDLLNDNQKIHINTADIKERKVVTNHNTIIISWDCCLEGRLELVESFQLSEDGSILWNIHLMNRSNKKIVVSSIGIPLMMDQYFRKDSVFKYEKNVMRHTGISNHASMIYWGNCNGNGPILLLQTIGDTALQTFERDVSGKFGTRGTIGQAFEGCFTAYFNHETTNESQIECKELDLNPSEMKSLSLRFDICDSYDSVERTVYESGNPVVHFLPGMVNPINEDILMDVYCKFPISVISKGHVSGDIDSDELDEVEILSEMSNGNQKLQQFRIKLHGYGVREFHLIWMEENGLQCTKKIQLFGIDDINQIILKHAQFIAQNQFETDESDPCYHGLLMWDMRTAKRVNSSHNPYGADWMRGGSDEIGLVSGLFLSEKNLYQPDLMQIRLLNEHVHDFIEDRLTEQPGYRVHRMVPWYTMFDDFKGKGADDIWRAFNYVHVINIYLNMYQIAKLYSYSFLDKPTYYLIQAYHYFQAMFTYWMFPDGVGATQYANMGEMSLALELGKRLKSEGFVFEAAEVHRIIQKKANYFSMMKYPFGSEMAFDTTAYEAVYAYGKAANDKDVMMSSLQAALSNRGKQPVWYLFQTDIRQMGDTNWNDSYMTQLAAWTMYDYALEQGNADVSIIEAWYASYLAGWALYNSGGYWSSRKENQGASAWIVVGEKGHFSGVVQNEWQKDPYLYGSIACSGESALGFYAALKIAASVVVNHPVHGRYGFGCSIDDSQDGITIIPKDGVGRRVFHIPEEWAVKVNRDRIKKVVCSHDGLRIYIENLTGDHHKISIMIRNKVNQWRNLEFELSKKQVNEIRILL